MVQYNKETNSQKENNNHIDQTKRKYPFDMLTKPVEIQQNGRTTEKIDEGIHAIIKELIVDSQ